MRYERWYAPILQVTKFAKGLSEFVSKCFEDVDTGGGDFVYKLTSEVFLPYDRFSVKDLLK